MPDQQSAGGFDFNGVFDPPKQASAPAQSSTDFDFSGVFPDATVPDSRSVGSRTLDMLTTPVWSPGRVREAAGVTPLPEWSWLGTLVQGAAALPGAVRAAVKNPGDTLRAFGQGVAEGPIVATARDLARNVVEQPSATFSGLFTGLQEGIASQSDPMTIASLLTMGTTAAVRPALMRALRALPDAERAIIAARLSGRASDVAQLRGEIQAARSQADIARALLQTARGVDLATSGALTARGVYKAATAESLPDLGQAVIEAGLGAAGMRGAPRVPARRAPVPLHAGELPPARGYSVTPGGAAIPAGVDVPASVVPDASYVSAVPGEYARREVRGYLPEPSGYVLTPDGVAVPIGQAGSVPRPAAPPDGSYVRAERGQFARRESRGALPPGPDFIASDSGVVPLARAGELTPGARPSLQEAVTALASMPKKARAKGEPVTVRAPVVDFTLGGGRVYSSDPAGTSVRNVQLDERERSEVRRMLAEMESMPFTPHTFLRDEQRVRNIGGAPEVIGGAGGAHVYTDILDLHGRGNPSRGDVIEGLQKTLKGEPSAYGPAIRETARERLTGHRRAQLPPEAGDPPLEPGRMNEDDFNAFDAFLTRLAGEDDGATLYGGLPVDPAKMLRLAKKHPMFAARLGSGVAGGLTGAASGDTTEERLQRALVYGAAGVAAPSLIRRGPAGTVLRGAPAGARVSAEGLPLVGGPVQPVNPTRTMPPARAIPKARLLEFPSIQKMPEETRGDIADLLSEHSGFAQQRRGVQPVGRTEAKADRIELPLEQLKPGTIVNAEELAAYKNAVASVMTKRHPLLEKIQRGTASDVEKLEFSRLTDSATVLVANYRGLKAETGRALNILRSKARVLDYGDQAFIEAAIKAPGFDQDIKEIAQAAIEAGGDPLKQLEWLRRRTRGDTFEMAQSAFYNSLLSGVKTHLRNTIGNSFNAVWNLAVPVAAAPVDTLRSTLTGREREVFFGELGPSISGAFSGIPQAYRNFIFTMQHGFTPKAVQRAGEGIFDTPRAELPGGMLTNFPSRALEAMDAAFRQIAHREELFAGAWAQARKEGLSRPNAVKARMTELIAGDSAASRQLQDRAEKFATRAVFQERPGVIGQSLINIKNSPKSPTALKVAATFVFPFVRTTGNILRQGAEATPLALGMGAIRQPGREGSQAVGRMVLGTAALTPLAYLASTGRLTGAAPSDPGERAAFYESGKRPNSVKIGDTWISYQLFQPLSVGMAAVANGWQRFMQSDRSDKVAEESMMAAVAGVGSSFLDQSFLTGVNGLIDAVNDPDRNAARFLSTMSQSLIPASGLLRNVTQAVDPVIRKPEGALESMQTIIPGLSSNVPARLGRFGQDVTRPGNAVQRGFLVPELSEDTSDPISQLLDTLGVTPQVPRSDIRLRGEVVKLTREQEHAVVKARGLERRRRLEVLMRRPAFANIPESRQREIVEAELSRASRTITDRAQSLLRRRESLTIESLLPSAQGNR